MKIYPVFISDTRASALAEFAVALPLLVVLVYGIFDFGGAFTLKEKLSNAAREGARYASGLPTNDLDPATTPPSVDVVRTLVSAYLVDAKVNDCGLGTMPAPGSGTASLSWTYTTPGGSGCLAPLVLTIQRSVAIPVVGLTPPPLNVISSTVSLQYAYPWHFNSVIQLIAPGANYGTYTQMTVDATVPNTD